MSTTFWDKDILPIMKFKLNFLHHRLPGGDRFWISPKGTTRYVVGQYSCLHPKVVLSQFISLSSTWIPKISLLSKLIFKPKANSKSLIRSNIFSRAFTSKMENSNMSSTNCKWFSLTGELQTQWAKIQLNYAPCDNNRLRQSEARIKRKGETGSPCQIPLEARIIPQRPPINNNRIENRRDASMDPISPFWTEGFNI